MCPSGSNPNSTKPIYIRNNILHNITAFQNGGNGVYMDAGSVGLEVRDGHPPQSLCTMDGGWFRIRSDRIVCLVARTLAAHGASSGVGVGVAWSRRRIEAANVI